MAVVAKSRRVRDFAERRVGVRNLPRRKFDAQPPDVFADRAAECFPKNAGKMNRMNTGDFDDILQNKRFCEIVMEIIFHLQEIVRNAFFARADSAS